MAKLMKMNFWNMKYKIFYQKDGKLHKVISTSITKFENIIKIKKINEKKFKLNEKEIFVFLFEIKNLLNSSINYTKALNHLQQLKSEPT